MRLIELLNNLARRMRRAPGSKSMAQPSQPSPAALEKMLRMIEQTQEQEYSCDDVLAVLDQFAEATQRGADVSQLMPLVQHHLDTCPDCQEEYEALLRILKASPAS